MNFKKIESGKVVMRNNAVCSVLGIGDVRSSLHDGSSRVLSEVRYIPELKRNLISLGSLDSNDFSYKAHGGVLKVTKGSLVVMKGEKKNGLYVLNGSTVAGTTAMTSQKPKKTSIWHKRLGHISEIGLIELSK